MHFNLALHPQSPATGIDAITGRIALDPHWLRIRWRIEQAAQLVIPAFAGKGRADGLWRSTCFELFLRQPGASAYVELNLSPSERWAAYDFSGPREGMADRAMPRDPVCTMRPGSAFSIFDAAVPLAGLPALPWQINVAAVIEERGGSKSLWALAHPEGKADFHDPTCFTGEVAAPQAA